MSKVLHSQKKQDDADDKDSIESDTKTENSDEKDTGKKSTTKLLHPFEVVEHMKNMWKFNGKLLDVIFGNLVCNQSTLQSEKGVGYKTIKFNPMSFFIEVLAVSPNRFRPENKLSENTYLHPHTVMLQKILKLNYELRQNMLAAKDKEVVFELKETFSKWMELQEAVNVLFDSTKSSRVSPDADSGIKQLLEKKEGIFRMKIMGKRVNYAARSVISPDPMRST